MYLALLFLVTDKKIEEYMGRTEAELQGELRFVRHEAVWYAQLNGRWWGHAAASERLPAAHNATDRGAG